MRQEVEADAKTKPADIGATGKEVNEARTSILRTIG